MYNEYSICKTFWEIRLLGKGNQYAQFVTTWLKFLLSRTNYAGSAPLLTIHRVLYWEEISACAAVRKRYVTEPCDRVRSVILLPWMMGTSFLLVVLTRLIVSKPKHWVTWSQTAGVHLPFLRVGGGGGGESNLVFLLNHPISNSLLLVL